MDTLTDATEQSWGAKVNAPTTALHRDTCPTWASRTQQKKWDERGLVVWDHAQHQIVRLHPGSALTLLDDLRQRTDWQQDGITIGETLLLSKTAATPHPPKEREGTSQSTTMTLEVPALFRDIGTPTLTNPMHITTAQAQHVFALLEDHEAVLRQIADMQERAVAPSLANAQRQLVRNICTRESQQVDLTTRPLPWIYDDAKRTWTCNLAPNRGTVVFATERLRWQGCIEESHLPKYQRSFDTFVETLSWVEQKLMLAAEEATQLQIPVSAPRPPAELSLATLTPKHRKRLSPFWIAPSVIEPPRLTYRVVAWLRHAPIRQKALELSFGEQWHYDNEYPTPTQLAQTLEMNAWTTKISESFTGLFTLSSVATYAEERMARERAEQFLPPQPLVRAIGRKTISGAAFGTCEVETGYITWIGGYGAWPVTPQTREQFMAEQAFELTIIHALDVGGFRALFDFPIDTYSDARLLPRLHRDRARSQYLPAAARAESAQWLREHAQTETKRSTVRK